MELDTFTLILFTVFNWLRVVAHVPQIFTAYRDRHGATAISYTSYSLFAGAHAATALYAITPLQDAGLALVSIAALTTCISVIVATAICRRRKGLGLNVATAAGAA